jgi:4-amino-4-deoxy-L-arabinose transferase-like glycosyltransferase
MTQKQVDYSFYVILLAYFSLLSYVAHSLSPSIKEINLFYSSNTNILWYLTHISTRIFGTTNFGFRLPFVLIYTFSVLLAYLLTEDYFSKPIDRLISIVIFMLLPGINSAALLMDNAIIVIFCILLYLYLVKLYGKEYYILLILFLFIDNSFAILYLALFFYSLPKKDYVLSSVSIALFILSMSIYGFEIGGHPDGYFLDTFAIYATIFSPVLFLYFFYTLYRVALKEDKDLYFYIAFTSLILSLAFSLRQKIVITDFAPFVVIAVPLMTKLFLHTYRVRLKSFRNKHDIFVKFMLIVLMLNTSILLFNKPIYMFLENPQKHFAYKYHIVNELALQLKKLGIKNIYTHSSNLQRRLDYFGVTKGNKYLLLEQQSPNYYKLIEIKYLNITVKKYYILLQK